MRCALPFARQDVGVHGEIELRWGEDREVVCYCLSELFLTTTQIPACLLSSGMGKEKSSAANIYLSK